MATKKRWLSEFGHTHSSSRFNRSPASLLAAIKEYAADSDLITLTETEYPGRKAVLHQLAGFGVVTGHANNRDDCSILYRRTRFRLIYSEQYKLSNRSLWLMGHRTPPSYACYAVFEDELTGLRFVVGVYHTPSAVQQALFKRMFKSLGAVAWQINTRSFRHRANQLRREHNAQGEMLAADWNSDFHLAWFRALIKQIYPAWTLNWNVDMASGYTHDHRLIDGTLVKGGLTVVKTHLSPDDDSSDHRPYWERLRLSRVAA